MSILTPIKALPKRDFLVELETAAQKRWADERIFEQDAPTDLKKPKYMATFPYPYQNGTLHLGHSFSISKPEFMVGYQRMKGKTALFPFGFHCTGMPIKAAADKLVREVELFGDMFQNYVEAEVQEDLEDKVKTLKVADVSKDPSKKKKHGKANAKETGLKYQFQIMLSMGVPLSEIHKFANPTHWIYYFPPLTITTLTNFGAHIDFRRSFITTDANLYYDSFIRWQFNRLRKMDKVLFGERFTVYSERDGQACMDHDRSSGEGVGVQEYTGIKIQVLQDELKKVPLENRFAIKGGRVGAIFETEEFKKAVKGREVYMVAATLRPETMYGQTNCFVGVDIEYGIFEVSDKEVWICTLRSARNMAFQGLFQEKGKVVLLMNLKGSDLIGVPLKAPLSEYGIVYVLPMEGVLEDKGTGIVTSVPSDSPDDYITLVDLKKKAQYYGVDECWVLDPIPVIVTEEYGEMVGVKSCEIFKVGSQKDKKALVDAKALAYKEGFYNGVMLKGAFKGLPVQEVKFKVKDMLVKDSLGFNYCEPEALVMSRSGDECVVSLNDQWYINYGEEEWKAVAIRCVDGMNMYGDETKNAFKMTLEWLSQWACSRSFGLGSRLPWDKNWLIESLSDSTVYMAYYTVAHVLHQSLDGSISTYGITPDQMTDEIWSHIMLSEPLPPTNIPSHLVEKMKNEFDYFYPLDLRTSGKDLINNHLTFSIYNHVAIFPPEKWPLAFRANGHLLLNNDKMSKSTGNFMTLDEALKRYGADATRFALADAGDGLDDANFLEKTADDAILKLYTEREWIVDALEGLDGLRVGTYNYADNVFEQELNLLVSEVERAYDSMLFREVVKLGYYDLQSRRNDYRKVGMNKDLVIKYIRLQCLLMAPIVPHWCESIWSLLGMKESVMNAKWPIVEKVDLKLLKSAAYVRNFVTKVRSNEDVSTKKKLKKGGEVKEVKDSILTICIASTFPKWQEDVIDILKNCYNGTECVGEREIIKERGLLKDKRIMPFVASLKRSVAEIGGLAFERTLEFNEKDTLLLNTDYLMRELSMWKVKEVIIEEQTNASADLKDASVPGLPTYKLEEM